MRGEPCTRRELETTALLRGQNVPWASIEERLGRPWRSLRSLLVQHRKGTLRWRVEKREARLAQAEQMIRAGASIGVMARHFGISRTAMWKFLELHGFDEEVRQLYRYREGAE